VPHAGLNKRSENLLIQVLVMNVAGTDSKSHKLILDYNIINLSNVRVNNLFYF